MTVRTSQPQAGASINRGTPLCNGIKQLFLGSDFVGISNGKAQNYANINGGSSTSNPPLRTINTYGICYTVSGAGARLQEAIPAAEVNARNPWTYACIAQISDPTKSAIAIIAEGVGGGTRDRSLYIDQSATKHFGAYLFDGVSRTAIGTTVVTAGVTYFLVITATSSLLSLYVNGVLEASTAVSNAGFNTYTTPFLVIGLGSQVGANDLSAAGLPIFIRCDNNAWTADMVKSFQSNPWQVFRQADDDLWFPSAPTLGLRGIGSSGGFGGGLKGTAVGSAA